MAAPSLSLILLHPIVLWLVTLAAFFLPLVFGLILAKTRFAPALLGIPRRVS